jgi:hypothetical protein
MAFPPHLEARMQSGRKTSAHSEGIYPNTPRITAIQHGIPGTWTRHLRAGEVRTLTKELTGSDPSIISSRG